MASEGIFTGRLVGFLASILLERVVRYETVAARIIPRIISNNVTQMIMNINFCKEKKKGGRDPSLVWLQPNFF